MAQGQSGTSDGLEIPRFPKRLEVPEGWFDYKPYGDVIAGTRIIPIKTPLKKDYNNGYPRGEGWILDYRAGVWTEDEFTPQQAVEVLQTSKSVKLSAVIDLTYTNRYYSSEMFKELGVTHTKVKCPGREVPSEDVYSRFVSVLRKSLASCDDPTTVVAVHCTHGLNRTGYLVCRFLMEEKGLTPDRAIACFNEARGHPIERINYLDHLRRGCPSVRPKPSPPRTRSSQPSHSPIPQHSPHPHHPHEAHQHTSHSSHHHTRGHGQPGWHGNRGRSADSARWRDVTDVHGRSGWHGNKDNSMNGRPPHATDRGRSHAGWHGNKERSADSANWRDPHGARVQGSYDTFEHWGQPFHNGTSHLGPQPQPSFLVANDMPYYPHVYDPRMYNGLYNTRHHPYWR